MSAHRFLVVFGGIGSAIAFDQGSFGLAVGFAFFSGINLGAILNDLMQAPR